MGAAICYLWFQFLQEAPMSIGVSELLTSLAERLTTLVLMRLVPEQIDVLVAVLALEMVLADLLEYMLLVTILAAKHSTTIYAKLSTVRETVLIGTTTFRTHAGTIMIFAVVIAFLTNLAVVVQAEVSRHCRDEVVVILAQKDVDFLHSFQLPLRASRNDSTVTLREDLDLIIWIKDALKVVDIGESVCRAHWESVGPEF